VIQIIAQKPDCGSFLILSAKEISGLTALPTTPTGYDLTYCQAWGLTINDDVIRRIIQDMRAKAYPPGPNYLDAFVKGDNEALGEYVAECLKVKTDIPKWFS